jgi:hypothetical protein
MSSCAVCTRTDSQPGRPGMRVIRESCYDGCDAQASWHVKPHAPGSNSNGAPMEANQEEHTHTPPKHTPHTRQRCMVKLQQYTQRYTLVRYGCGHSPRDPYRSQVRPCRRPHVAGTSSLQRPRVGAFVHHLAQAVEPEGRHRRCIVPHKAVSKAETTVTVGSPRVVLTTSARRRTSAGVGVEGSLVAHSACRRRCQPACHTGALGDPVSPWQGGHCHPCLGEHVGVGEWEGTGTARSSTPAKQGPQANLRKHAWNGILAGTLEFGFGGVAVIIELPPVDCRRVELAWALRHWQQLR